MIRPHLPRFLTTGLTIAFVVYVLTGCSFESSPILHPKGPVTETERDLMLLATGIMAFTLIPVYLLTFWCCWRYRADKNGCYRPDWHKSWQVELFIWTGPVVIVAILGYLVYVYTYRLDPYKALDNQQNTFKVQAVALNWKWLFIYPEQNVATVNELVFPSHRTLSLEITSDTVMTSFMIPALGGQIYAMAGMTTHLNLQSYKSGRFTGRNTQFSGRGFAGMVFDVQALSRHDFERWLETVRRADNTLDSQQYLNLTQPDTHHPVEYFSAVTPDLFDKIIARYDEKADEKSSALPKPEPYNVE
ncbi:COX aromatic rich motif-containing protein [Endozoicomonas montiporae]|uniref:Ubiquinol oxidase subunit 2 n=1 Tax=Endozoicomonas montiporae CL-33 TaxID=570277 RepID=A0A142BDQ0_9GAMM|nr:COX aromatic rich motif-containing protein [Endozoicomonas montiporae]AMO56876.1 cytochrome o ubiquinol oxidase subunit II [Endozoicomonas montiporae CL-33]